MRIKIGHMYPDLLNLYGDQGNVLVLYRRAEWRGLEVVLENISVGDRIDFNNFDLLFIGGGSDNEQSVMAQDLLQKGPELVSAVKNGTALLSICGGYQLLGKYYRTRDGLNIPGVGLFDCWTEAGQERLEGNILLRANDSLKFKTDSLIGFENHSGKTFLGKGVSPLGWVTKGNGNNGQDGTEGVICGNALGSYLHGPLLAKNPHLADFLLMLAIKHAKGNVHMPELNDSLEWQAHNVMKERIIQKKDRLTGWKAW